MRSYGPSQCDTITIEKTEDLFKVLSHSLRVVVSPPVLSYHSSSVRNGHYWALQLYDEDNLSARAVQ